MESNTLDISTLIHTKRKHFFSTPPHWWTRRNYIAFMLLPLSALFWVIITLRRAYWQRYWKRHHSRLLLCPYPIIVVGNLTVGGSGKTPCVIAIAHWLTTQGYRPGIVTRGYLRNKNEDHFAENASLSGDEAALMARHGFPVAVANRRVNAIKQLLNAEIGINIILSDDGLQHYAMPRDIELILIDHKQLGNRWLLPSGPLREPLTRQGDAKLWRHHSPHEQPTLPTLEQHFVFQDVLTQVMPLTTYLGQQHATHQNLNHKTLRDFQNQPVQLFAAIAAPERFFQALKAQGITAQACHALPDHASDIASYLAMLPKNYPVLLTEKDAVKLFNVPERFEHVWVVCLTVELQHAFYTWLHERLSTFKTV